MNLIKDSIDKIFPFTSIITLSITSGIVPNQLKIARVIPLFKSGEEDIFTNYRPVPVLPAFSKILERVMYNCLLRFLNVSKILSYNCMVFANITPLLMLLLVCMKKSLLLLKIGNIQMVFL